MLVPRLRLGVFAAAATCDVLGDGDAIAFPFMADLIPLVEAALEAEQKQKDHVPDLEKFVGQYCSPSSPVNVTLDDEDASVLAFRNYDELPVYSTG